VPDTQAVTLKIPDQDGAFLPYIAANISMTIRLYLYVKAGLKDTIKKVTRIHSLHRNQFLFFLSMTIPFISYLLKMFAKISIACKFTKQNLLFSMKNLPAKSFLI